MTLTNEGVIKLDLGSLYDAGQLVNTAVGELRKNGDTLSSIGVKFDNDGVVSVLDGVMTLSVADPVDGSTLAADAGVFDVAAGSDLRWTSGTHVLGSSSVLRGDGTFRLAGATLDVGADGLTVPGEFYVDSGTLAGSGALSGGTFRWNNAVTLGSWDIPAGSTLDLFENADYQLPAGVTLTNEGVIKLDLGSLYDAGQLVNTAVGELRKNGDTNSSITSGFDNLGTVKVDAGTLSLPSGATAGGVSLYGADGKSLKGGTYVVADGAQVRLGNVTNLANNHAKLVVHGTGAVADANGSPLMSGLETNTGALDLRNGARFTTEALTNSGIVGLWGTSQLSAPAYTQTAGRTQLRDAGTRLVATTVTLQGGLLQGTGTVVGAVVNEGATVAPGNSPGTLSVTGAFTQMPAGKLQMEIADAGSDKLVAGGAVNLAGSVVFDVTKTQLDWSDAFSVVQGQTLAVDPAVAYSGLPGNPEGGEYRVVNDPATGKLIFDVHDTQAPQAPAAGAVSATSGHVASTWSNNPTVALSVPEGQDNAGGSGFKGYVVEWLNPANNTVVQTTGLTATLPSGKYAVRVMAEDSDGNVSDATTLTGEYWIDLAKPTNVAMNAFPKWYSLLGTAKKPQIKPTWKVASDVQSGVAAYRILSQSVAPDSTTWVQAEPLTVTGTSKVINAAPGRTYCLRLEVTDAAGNVATSGERCVGAPLDNKDLTATGKWTATSSSASYRGSYAQTSAAGATLSKANVRAKRIELIVSTCPTCGQVDVFLGKTKLASKSLVSKKAAYQVPLLVKEFSSVKTGNLIVKVTSKGKPVRVDAVAFSAK